MKRITIALLTLLISFSISQSQVLPKIYLGFEGGPDFSIYEHTDNGNKLYTPLLSNAIYGFPIEYELKKINLAFETGFYGTHYHFGYGIKGESAGESSGIKCWQIPVRIKNHFFICRDKFSIGGVLGISYSFANSYNETTGQSLGGKTGNFGIDTGSIPYSVHHYRLLARNFYLLETGLILEWRLFDTFKLSVSSSYHTGFKNINEGDITYRTNISEPSFTGKIFSKGDYFDFRLGLKYLLIKKRGSPKTASLQ